MLRVATMFLLTKLEAQPSFSHWYIKSIQVRWDYARHLFENTTIEDDISLRLTQPLHGHGGGRG